MPDRVLEGWRRQRPRPVRAYFRLFLGLIDTQTQMLFHWLKIPVIMQQWKIMLNAKCSYYYIYGL